MCSNLILSFTVPIVGGLFSLAVALLAAHWERRKELIRLRLNAYCRLETALSDWTDSKTVLTTAKVYDACNVIYIVGSERTRAEVQAVAAKVSTAGLCAQLMNFEKSGFGRLKLCSKMCNKGEPAQENRGGHNIAANRKYLHSFQPVARDTHSETNCEYPLCDEAGDAYHSVNAQCISLPFQLLLVLPLCAMLSAGRSFVNVDF